MPTVLAEVPLLPVERRNIPWQLFDPHIEAEHSINGPRSGAMVIAISVQTKTYHTGYPARVDEIGPEVIPFIAGGQAEPIELVLVPAGLSGINNPDALRDPAELIVYFVAKAVGGDLEVRGRRLLPAIIVQHLYDFVDITM